jgi:RNA polymerase sigma-70 factor (ECF subfamily)
MPGSETVRLFQQGDTQALERLIHEHSPALYRYLYFITTNEELARDMTHATFITAYERRKTLLDPNKFRAWIFTIGRRKAHREMSRASRRREVPFSNPPSQSDLPPRTEDSFPDQKPGAGARLADQHARQILDDEIHTLDELTRDLILGHFVEGRSTKELSEAFGIPYGTACTRIFRGLRQLRQALEQRGISLKDFIS